jgi:hypothetical protein
MTNEAITHGAGSSDMDAGEPVVRRPFVRPVVETLGDLQTATLVSDPPIGP